MVESFSLLCRKFPSQANIILFLNMICCRPKLFLGQSLQIVSLGLPISKFLSITCVLAFFFDSSFPILSDSLKPVSIYGMLHHVFHMNKSVISVAKICGIYLYTNDFYLISLCMHMHGYVCIVHFRCTHRAYARCMHM